MANNFVVTPIRLTPSKLQEVKLTREERPNFVPASFYGHLAESVASVCRTVAIDEVCYIRPSSCMVSR